MTKKNEIGALTELVIIVVGVLALVAGYLWIKNRNTIEVANLVPKIESRTDLDSASKDLDSADTTQVDKGLNQLNSDTNF